MALKISRPILTISHTGPVHRGTIVFLHGSGDTGNGLWDMIRFLAPDFKFPHVKILLPTAPLQPYMPAEGMPTNVWFDRLAISKKVPEIVTSIDASAEELQRIIDEEINSGIPEERIIVGGFSMGGAMALHLGYRFRPNIAGVFALSSFLNDNSAVYKVNGSKLPPLFQWHGARDDMVPMANGAATYAELKNLGIEGEFRIGKTALHELKKDILYELKDWITKLIPE